MMRILAIDVGSSSVKAGIWKGRTFTARTRIGLRSVFEGVKVEVPADGVLRAVHRAVREATRGGATVDVVSFCAFSPGVVVVNARGNVRAGAITHQDRRSAAEAADLCRRLGKRWLLQHTGNLPYPGGIGSSTLAWLRTHAPHTFAGDYRIGQLSSLVGWMLTGEWVIDPSQAAFLGLRDLPADAWSERLCDAVGVNPSSLPRTVWADETWGKISRTAAKSLGLREGTPVTGGFVDGSAGMVLTPMADGQLVHNSGSTDVLAMCTKKPASTEGILSRPVGVGANFPERWLAVRTIAAAGSAVDWARRVLFSELADARWRTTLKKVCGRLHDGGATCIPTFAGQRASIAQRNGATFDAVTLATTREQLLASIVRGLVDESARSYALLAKIHRPRKRVYAMGGAGTLQHALHRAWPARHHFKQLEGDSLRGLVALARRATD